MLINRLLLQKYKTFTNNTTNLLKNFYNTFPIHHIKHFLFLWQHTVYVNKTVWGTSVADVPHINSSVCPTPILRLLCLVKRETIGTTFLPARTAIGGFSFDNVTFVAERTWHTNHFVWIMLCFDFLHRFRLRGLRLP